MATMLHVKPKQGLRVPNPDTGSALPTKGGRVPDNQYWRRRLRDGDVQPVVDAKPSFRGKKNDQEASS